MNLVVRDASPSEKRGNAMSAALAKEQLEYAVKIVKVSWSNEIGHLDRGP